MADYKDLVRSHTKRWLGILLRAGVPLVPEGEFPQRQYNVYVLEEFGSKTAGPFGAQALLEKAETDPRQAVFQLQLYALLYLLGKYPMQFALNHELNAEFRDLVFQNDQYGLPIKNQQTVAAH